MMKRLVEQTESRHPLVARAAKMLASGQPLAPSDAMRRRVLASVVREHPPFAARRRWLARPAALVAVLLATTAAAASFHDGWLPRAYWSAVGRGGARPWTSVGWAAHHALAEGAKTSGASASTVVETSPPSQTALELGVEASLLASGIAAAKNSGGAMAEADLALDLALEPSEARPRHRAGKAWKRVRPRDAWDDGAILVLSAMQVLRRQRDGARAGQLLEDYLIAHPLGALREEAMALAVEAASARGDGRESRRLAARYDHAFPDGRFRQDVRPTAGYGSL
jgi:hypothetical protein